MGKSSKTKAGISAELLCRAFTAAPCGCVITDHTRRGNPVVYVNPAYGKLTGIASDEILGRSSSFLLGKGARKETLAQVRKSLKAGQSCTAVLPASRKDGTSPHMEISLAPLSDRSGRTTHFIWMLRDVSGPVLREEELGELLAEKEGRFAAYMGHANEAIWRLDFEPPLPLDAAEEEQVQWMLDHAVFSEANDAGARLYGLASGRGVVGRPLREFMPASDPKTIETLTDLVRSGFMINNLISHETAADGTGKAILNNIKPDIVDGRVRHIWGASLDLSDFFEAQQELEVSQKELAAREKDLEEKNAALKELLSLVEEEKKEIKEKVAANIEQVVLPALEKVRTNNGEGVHLDLVYTALEDLSSSFGRRLEAAANKLTPREVEVCNLVRNGLESKEIARALNIALHTVEKHRRMARNKLGLANKGVNLRTYLKSL